MRFLLLVFSILTICLLSCSKDNETDTNYSASEPQALIDCHNQDSHTLRSLQDELIGEWNWAQQYNPWQNNTDTTQFVNGKLKFRSDGSLTWTVMDSTATGTWSLTQNSPQSFCEFSLDTDILEIYTNGCFFLCENEFFVYNSPVDGVDVWYYRN